MKKRSAHSHGWLVGVGGVLAGAALMVVFPKFPAVWGSLLLVALFHIVGAAVALGSAWSILEPRLEKRLTSRDQPPARGAAQAFDFGWTWGAMNGPFLAAAALLTTALGLQLAAPRAFPAWFALALLGVAFAAGGLLLRTTRRLDAISLPLVDLLSSDHDLVLDAGCGAGRTTLTLARVLAQGRVVAVDRFDAAYIDGGGRALLERNLQLAGLTDRVQIQPADLTALPFPDAHFDAAVSAHVIDHLGAGKAAGLAEIRRVLKPGARFLMVVWVPGWVTFCLANVFCLALTTPAGWRGLITGAGLTLVEEGSFNGMWFALLERPAAP